MSDIWTALETAIAAGRQKEFTDLCELHENTIRATIRQRSRATDRSTDDLGVAERFWSTIAMAAEFLEIELELGVLSRETEERFDEIDALTQDEPERALEELKRLITDISADSDLIVPAELGFALALGRMGTIAFRLGRYQDAWDWNTTAQEYCHAIGDADGCVNYFANLQVITQHIGTAADSLTIAGMAVHHIEEHGPRLRAPEFLAHYCSAKLDHEGVHEIEAFIDASARHAHEFLDDDNPAELGRVLEALADVAARAGLGQLAAALHEDTIASLPPDDRNETIRKRALSRLAEARAEDRDPTTRMLYDELLRLVPAVSSPEAAFTTLIRASESEHDLGNDERAIKLVDRAQEVAREAFGRTWREDLAIVLRASFGAPVLDWELLSARDNLDHEPEVPATLLTSVLSAVGYWFVTNDRPAEGIDDLERSVVGTSLGSASASDLDRFNRLAVARHKLHQDAQAENLYRAVLDRRRALLPAGDPAIAQSMFNLAMVLLRRRDFDEAAELLHEQFELEDRYLQLVLRASSEEQRIAYATTLLGYLDSALIATLMACGFSPPPDLIEVFADAVLRRKGIATEAAARDRSLLVADGHDRANRLSEEIEILRLRRQRGALQGLEPGALDEVTEEQARLEAELALELHADSAAELVTSEDIAAALPAGTVLADWYRLRGPGSISAGDALYLAFVISPDAVQLVVAGVGDEIDEAVDEWRHLLETGSAREVEVGSHIFHTLLGAVWQVRTSDTRLLLSPDGHLGRVPFAALPYDDGTRLVDRVSLGWLATGRDLLRPNVSHASGRPVVVADPEYELADPNGNEWAPFDRLAGTRVEGRWVASHLDAELLTGRDASQPALVRLRSPFVLHIATHGYSTTSPLRPGASIPPDAGRSGPALGEDALLCSGLALAGADTWLRGDPLPGGWEDGLLTAADVYALDLLGTELVVLSACETGLGHYRDGEGIFGLRRIFEIAGARSILVSMWKVPDAPTGVFMREFYRSLLRGQARVDAVRDAALAVRRRYPEPLAWAAFALFGAQGAIW